MQIILGEKREITIHISSTKDQPFTIRNAKWNLINRNKGLVVESGACTVVDKNVSALIQPQVDGSYILEFSYEIANEILKATVKIEVTHYARA